MANKALSRQDPTQQDQQRTAAPGHLKRGFFLSGGVKMGIPLSEWSGSGATRELHETIKQFNAEASRQTRQLLVLTRVIAVLTVVMAVEVGVQMYLAWRALL